MVRHLLTALGVAWPLLVGVAGALVLNAYWQTIGIGFAVYGAAGIGLAMLLRLGGMLSFAQGAFVGLGMYAVAKSPWGVGEGSIAFAVLVGLGIAVVVGLLTLRLHHLYFLLATLALVIIAESVVRAYPRELGGAAGLVVETESPFGLRGNQAYFLAAWTLVAVCLAASRALDHSRFGRAAAVMSVDPVLASVIGVATGPTRLTVFVTGSIMAVFAGALYAHFLLAVAPFYLGLLPTIQVLVGAIIGGGGAGASVVGVAVVRLLPELTKVDPAVQMTVTGAILAAIAAIFPHGLRWHSIAARLPRLLSLGRHSQQDTRSSGGGHGQLDLFQANGSSAYQTVVRVSVRGDDGPVLRCIEVRVSFKGVKAVDGVSLDVEAGQVVGLIGPNGAGKTTFFNYVTGLVPHGTGTVRLNGTDISRWRAYQRARAGLARTFQIVRPLYGFRALDIAIAGAYRLGRGGLLQGLTLLDLPERRRMEDLAWEALALCGIEHLAHQPLEALSAGDLRRLDLARALASRPLVLLLDEPASGLERSEWESMVALITQLAATGVALVVVEHNMDFVMSVCHELAVLENGRLIARGKPEDVRQDPEVLRAYLV